MYSQIAVCNIEGLYEFECFVCLFLCVYIYSLRYRMSCVKDIISWQSADLFIEFMVIENVT
jgi:hypothetical protein